MNTKWYCDHWEKIINLQNNRINYYLKISKISFVNITEYLNHENEFCFSCILVYLDNKNLWQAHERNFLSLTEAIDFSFAILNRAGYQRINKKNIILE